MSFYDDASLIMFPSGYKEDKIYSLKPTDGSGDLTFTRASTATRVNADGLIETSPVNLATNSENYTLWNLANVTVTANDITAPNGTLTADKLTISSNGNDVKQTISVMPNSVYTWTFYVYGGTATGQQMRFYDNTNSTNIEYYNYSSSVVLGAWVKIERTFTTPSGCYEIQAWVLAATSTIGTMWVWGAQLNIGATAKPYFPTTDRLNVPRIDYTGGGCGKLLLEPQRTNLLTYSESLANQDLQGSYSISANSSISPDGTQNADKIAATASTSYMGAYVALIANNTYSVSMFAKSAGKDWVFLYEIGSTIATTGVWFNVSTGQVGTVGSAWSNAKIENYGNGWYRVSATTTLSSSNYLYWLSCDSDGSAVTTPNGSDGVLLWGLSYESGSYVSSYIPTLASSVTRLADAASKTGISSLIGQTQGTIYLDFELQTTNQDMVIMNIYDAATPANSVYFYVTGTNILQAFVDNSGTQATISSGVLAQGRYKAALVYKANDFAFYVNGSLIGVDTSGTVPTCNALRLENYAAVPTYQEKMAVNQAILFPTRLTNTQLATLTTI